MDAAIAAIPQSQWLSLPEARAAIMRRYGSERGADIIDERRELLPQGALADAKTGATGRGEAPLIIATAARGAAGRKRSKS